jgi:hypothetical protein
MDKSPHYIKRCESMEKLWLAFIMLEKYKKKWTEKEWVSL